ncbi:hypothetical protein [Rufibacter quisquiliarum]|uniref:Glycosyl transferase family 28 C-terminal domain-containing protein n=1 Tax=Rufibacter quisquiliarum TaxID=1549639 RepID=A0A839GH80_9BACT|nr:hypothetical protein [Rufibacter quisquiliarum]MBA9076973.1 hypothetical protein [Rufibacter quisquiliarum]
MKIFSLICHNGLGHFKRSVAVLSELQRQLPGVQITVACEKWQVERMQDWEVAAVFFANTENVRYLDGLVFPGVYWDKNPLNYQDRKLTEWHHRLANVQELHEADLVLSDNLSQVLLYRPDAVLLGSFLWSDILEDAYPEVPFVTEFVEEERRLLATYKPRMLCVGDIVMPGVVKQTEAIKLPWFCEVALEKEAIVTERGAEESHFKIALLGGATDSIANELQQLAQALLKNQRVELFLPKGLVSVPKGGEKNLHVFDHSETSFSALDLIICRPGVGTLTDAICYKVPVAAVYEAGNIEMEHNATVVEQLQIGVNLGSLTDVSVSCAAIFEFLGSSSYSLSEKKIQARPRGGVEAAAAWVIENMK